MNFQKEVWVIGLENSLADRTISWDEKLPNLSDPDVLIIYLDSLTEEKLDRFPRNKITELHQAIIDKFKNGGTVIFILSHAYYSSKVSCWNTWVAPIGLVIKHVSEGKRIKFESSNPFSEYLNQVTKFNYYFETFNSNALQEKVGSPLLVSIIQKTNYTVYDNSGHVLGMAFTKSLFPLRQSSDSTEIGELIFLPPTTKIPVSDGVELLVSQYGKKKSQESSPEWVKNVKINGTKKIISKLQKLENQKLGIDEKLKAEYSKLIEIYGYTRLLYSKDIDLEEVVFEAMKFLGIDDIRKIREDNREDWLFEFKTTNEYSYGVIEVKGSDNKTKQRHLTQCSKWVDEIYYNENKISKGIFISNQYRKEPYADSREKRIHFEPNELEYAKMKDICIMPSCVLFELVNERLKGTKIIRKRLENMISGSKGLFKY